MVNFQGNQVFRLGVGTKKRRPAFFGVDTPKIGFVRVRKRKLKGAQRASYDRPITSSTSFDIIRSVRVDGRPQHQFVLGLGSQKIIDPHGPCRFWIEAIRRMIRYGLTEAQRRQLIGEMAAKGARLPPDCDQHRIPSWLSGCTQEIEELRSFIGLAGFPGTLGPTGQPTLGFAFSAAKWISNSGRRRTGAPSSKTTRMRRLT